MSFSCFNLLKYVLCNGYSCLNLLLLQMNCYEIKSCKFDSEILFIFLASMVLGSRKENFQQLRSQTLVV